jgi:hypothetical protein
VGAYKAKIFKGNNPGSHINKNQYENTFLLYINSEDNDSDRLWANASVRKSIAI